MQGLEVIITASAGVSVFILGTVFWVHYRIGKLEGAARNGDFFACPFYRKKLNEAAGCNAGNKRQQSGKNSSCRNNNAGTD